MTKLKLFFSALMLLTIGNIFAQITTSSLSAKVNDGTSPLADAEVTLTHIPTNAVYRAVTNKQGRFSFENLNAGGPYELEIKSKDTKDYTNSQIHLALGDNESES
jgi:uncharacterized protein (DUF2249 family)